MGKMKYAAVTFITMRKDFYAQNSFWIEIFIVQYAQSGCIFILEISDMVHKRGPVSKN